jgi:hypothetical protein
LIFDFSLWIVPLFISALPVLVVRYREAVLTSPIADYAWMLPIGRGHDHLAEGLAGKLFEGWERIISGLSSTLYLGITSRLPFIRGHPELVRQQHAD